MTNGVSASQREMDRLVEDEKLKDTFPCLDNITVSGRNQEEHDKNAKNFLTAISSRNMSLNESKIISSVNCINILGYCVGNVVIKPDQERLRPLRNFQLLIPRNCSKRVLGLFVYYGYLDFLIKSNA